MAIVSSDAGHCGYDYGATNGSRLEKNDNLRLALAVGSILRNCGVTVVYTRSTDIFVPLIDRSRISNNAGADLFVSIHRNSSVNPAYNGVESWVYLQPQQRAVTLANNILDRLNTVGVQNNRGVKYGDFAVLTYTNAPATLLELGFISNAQDNLLFDTRFNEYANAIAGGILATLGISCVTPSGVLGIVTTGGSNLNLRSAPSTTASVIGSIPNGTILNVTGSSGNFFQVIFQNTTGYASKDFIQLTRNGVVETGGGNLNMRSGPSATTSVVRTVPNGSIVSILGQSNNFYQIVYSGTFGYASMDFIREIPTGTVTTGGSNLNLRSAPSATASVAGSIPDGTILPILGSSGNFYKVNFKGIEGYVSKDFVRTTSNFGRVSTGGSNLNLRSGPSVTYAVIATVPDGSIITITGSSGNFYQIIFNGITGYASKDFIVQI